MPRKSVAISAVVVSLFGCSSTVAAPDDAGVDASIAADGGLQEASTDAASDALSTDAPTLLTIAEKEPNNGATAAEIQDITVPSIVTGAIDPVGDVDGFRAKLQSGDLFVWRLEPTGADLAPYIGVVEKDDSVPHFVARGEKGKAVELEQFVTKTGDWNIAITDSNNTSGKSPVGGATFGYKLTAQKQTRAFTPVTVGGTVAAALTGPNAVGLFELTLAAKTALDVNVRAKRLSTPSDIDTRLTLVNKADGSWMATNDDLSSAESDSRLGSDGLPAGSYILVVENVAPLAKTLAFEVAVTKR